MLWPWFSSSLLSEQCSLSVNNAQWERLSVCCGIQTSKKAKWLRKESLLAPTMTSAFIVNQCTAVFENRRKSAGEAVYIWGWFNLSPVLREASLQGPRPLPNKSPVNDCSAVSHTAEPTINWFGHFHHQLTPNSPQQVPFSPILPALNCS